MFSNAAANSFNVSNASGALSTKLEIAVRTKAVVANWVVFVPADAVSAFGTPVKVGPSKGAFAFKVFCKFVLSPLTISIFKPVTLLPLSAVKSTVPPSSTLNLGFIISPFTLNLSLSSISRPPSSILTPPSTASVAFAIVVVKLVATRSATVNLLICTPSSLLVSNIGPSIFNIRFPPLAVLA